MTPYLVGRRTPAKPVVERADSRCPQDIRRPQDSIRAGDGADARRALGWTWSPGWSAVTFGAGAILGYMAATITASGRIASGGIASGKKSGDSR